MMSINDLSPIQLPTVSEAVYETLKQQIVAGKLTPGTQLNLTQLESQLDVSRTPLRSALAQLQSEGLVEIHPRRGTYVTQFNQRDIDECYELRIALETHALHNVFDPRQADRLKKIIHLLEYMDTLLTDEEVWLENLPEFMSNDRAFHLEVVSLSDNERIRHAYEFANVQGYIAIMGAKFHYSDVLDTKSEHLQILSALHARNLDDVLTTARVHLEGAKRRSLWRLGSEGV